MSGVTACLGRVGPICVLASPGSSWQIPCCCRMLVMPVILQPWNEGLGMRALERDFYSKKEITSESFWAKTLSLVRAAIGRCKDKVFKKKTCP